MKTSEYFLDELGRFVITQYNQRRPFASFLPGIAGKKGTPLWTFYVNRGQCIASFGVFSKDRPILEFHPAFRSYQLTQLHGFRTFVKVDDGEPARPVTFYEPFTLASSKHSNQLMIVGINELEIIERNEYLGLDTSVTYFTLPNEPVPALVRTVEIRNTCSCEKKLEILDGLATVLPTGINDYLIKHMGNTIKAWMDVFWLDNGVPLFKLRASTEDVARVYEIDDSNFYLTVLEGDLDSDSGVRLAFPVIVDPDLIFGVDTSYSSPEGLLERSVRKIVNTAQHPANKIPCAFTPVRCVLRPNGKLRFHTVVGYAKNEKVLERQLVKFLTERYFDKKLDEARAVATSMTELVETKTGNALFDRYVAQTFIDNILRGGFPEVFTEGRRVFYTFSRKHGDLERDYNYFIVPPEYYSSGNANYRDINQNRREDVFFNPKVGSYNIKCFVSLIQADGYNPLIINGVRYRCRPECSSELGRLTNEPEKLEAFLLENEFTPGALLSFIEDNGIALKVDWDEFLSQIIRLSDERVDAAHGEGFWTDHWVYNLDLIESYLSVYPERERELLFGEREYTYYDSTYVVLPRHRRYVLANGKVRQYRSVEEDPEKKVLINSRESKKHLLRTEHGRGDVFITTLAVKLVNLALVKFATLDPSGVGIEMEAGKPGWYDALNGLPGIFGSSVADAFELLRLLNFLTKSFGKHWTENLDIPIEVIELMGKLELAVRKRVEDPGDSDRADHAFWEAISTAREAYREKTKLGFDGRTVKMSAGEVCSVLLKFAEYLGDKLMSATHENGGLPPTYFYYEPVEFEIIGEDTGTVKVKKFERRKMPLFLEGIVKFFKAFADVETLRIVHNRTRNSELFDSKLKMYKLNAPLEGQSFEIGRAKAFTPGWLENESIWLHMEYKYLLELLRAGLYDEFFEDFRNALVPFLDPATYGRSVLENSSFIVSSAYPDSSLHGRGFVARLTGATAEFLSMWRTMMVGPSPFEVRDEQLVLKLSPVLPGWLFDEKGEISFRFLGRCVVTYHNPARLDTYRVDGPKEVRLQTEGLCIKIEGGLVPEPYSKMVRDGKAISIDAYF